MLRKLSTIGWQTYDYSLGAFVPATSDIAVNSDAADIRLYTGNYDFDNVAAYRDIYLDMLETCIRMKYSTMLNVPMDSATITQKVAKCVNWLNSTDFFTAPASTRYHDSCEHGLLIHTITAVRQAYDLIKIKKFESVDLLSAITCLLVHDWCKIGLYEPYNRNVKNPETGIWEQVRAYNYNSAPVPLGHGVASYFMASRFIPINLSEAEAIRWHMGGFQVVQQEISEIIDCNASNPLNLFVQFADHLAITNY